MMMHLCIFPVFCRSKKRSLSKVQRAKREEETKERKTSVIPAFHMHFIVELV